MNANDVYAGSDGELTKKYYGALEQLGPVGLVAMNLFRAQKCSARAKVYRGGISGKGSYKHMAYERKAWSMQNLVEILRRHAEDLGIRYGWKPDPDVPFGNKPSWVLYIDLPSHGQVSFHSPDRFNGPDYPGEWDQQHKSCERILAFCDEVLSAKMAL